MNEQLHLTGKYSGPSPTETEQESGEAVEQARFGPLRPNSVGHQALAAWRSGERLTAYTASARMTGDYHAIRREATRLVVRGFLQKDGTLPNHAPRGRKNVDAYRITAIGRVELDRLDSL